MSADLLHAAILLSSAAWMLRFLASLLPSETAWLPRGHTAMEDAGLLVSCRENFQMHAIFCTVFTKAVLVIGCRIIASEQRPAFLAEYI